jgi:hypothetical protein
MHIHQITRNYLTTRGTKKAQYTFLEKNWGAYYYTPPILRTTPLLPHVEALPQ